jgi:carbon-monoxide dehydrogenase medium subunit
VKWFDYAAPQSVDDALQLAAQHAGALPLAGGTDLLVQMRVGRKNPPFVIDIKKIPELNELSFDSSTGLTLGAATPCYLVAKCAAVHQYYPAIAEVASLIGGTQIQGRASIGGNLCNAAPSADSIPLLIAMGAQCLIAGPGGRRTVAVEDFCIAPGKTVLAPGLATYDSFRAMKWISRWWGLV